MIPENKCIRANPDYTKISSCQQLIAERKDFFVFFSKVLSLTGNVVRLKILYLFSKEKELCPCDLADILSMSVPAISQHLRKLRDADIVKSRREGQTIFYSLKKDCLHIIEPLVQHINNSKDALV